MPSVAEAVRPGEVRAGDSAFITAGSPDDAKHGRRRPRRWVRCVAVLLLVFTAVSSWSYAHALTARGSAGWQMRTVEWLRNHGAGGTVDNLEVWYYTRHHPPTSGVPSRSLPGQPSAHDRGVVAAQRAYGVAPRVDPAVRPALPGEASWTPGPASSSGRPAIYTTWFRPDPRHPTLTAGVLWIDQSQSRLDLVAGTMQPGGGPWPGHAEVDTRHRPATVAAFNAGFLMRDAQGGFYENGHRARRLRNGQASVVIRRDGRATVGRWGRDVALTPDVWAVRQNLALIVDHGRAVRGLTRNGHFRWGSRRSQLEYVWRSGIGVDPQGHLIYIAGDKFNLTTLAAAFVQAHAIRAMELDIHFGEVSANLYSPGNGTSNHVNASKLLPGMPRPATRYLQPDQRDFFTVRLR